MTIQAHEWVHPTDKNVQTIYYQGLMASQAQAAKYIDPSGFVTTTGDRAVCQRAAHLIENLFIGKEIDEVKFFNRETHDSYAQYAYPLTYAYHLFKMLELDRHEIEIIPVGSALRTAQAHRVNVSKVSFGQGVAMNNHHEKYTLCVKKYPDADIILFGVSQGATATFNACAHNNYTNMRLVILESPFDSMRHMIHTMPLAAGMLMRQAIKLLPSYDIDGVQPFKCVDRIPKNVPIMFITSHADTRVPAECTLNLARTLVKTGHQQVYVLELKSSRHSRYTLDDEADRALYQGFVHALYKKYNVPYIAEFADRISDIDAYRLVV